MSTRCWYRRRPARRRRDWTAPAIRSSIGRGPFFTSLASLCRLCAARPARPSAFSSSAAWPPALLPAARAYSTPTLLLLAGLSLVWGMNWPAIKFVLADVPVLTFRSLCLWIAGPTFLVLARLGGERIGIPGREWPALLLASFCHVTLWYFGTGMGVSLIPAGPPPPLAYPLPGGVAL